MPDPFLLTLATTTVLRGLGAGFISGVEWVTFSARRRLPIAQYAQFSRAHYRGEGVFVYAGTTVTGSFLTFVLSIAAFREHRTSVETSSLVLSVLATISSFAGTGVAFPAMLQLWRTGDDDEVLLAELLDRFARWGLLSAVSHIVAFVALVIALTVAGNAAFVP